ncbi:hypothetical protein QE152_g15503 [Popillia japonica]|uniref:Uncharacterized protein n=1 Tax=Popillia japonica TaxID=7064 RepID=A0AAW1L7G1_POPJA
MANGRNIFDFHNSSHVQEMLKRLENEEEDTIGEDFSDDIDTDGEDNVETQNDNCDTEKEGETQREDESSSAGITPLNGILQQVQRESELGIYQE